MALLYLRSTDGSDADNATTWALAKASMAGICAIDAAGDTVYVSDAHAATVGGGGDVTWAFAGTPANPVIVVGGDDAAEPPTAVTSPAAAYEQTTGTGDIYVTGSVHMSYMILKAGDGTASGANMWLNASTGHAQTYDNCAFELRAASGQYIYLGMDAATANLGRTVLRNCKVYFNQTGNSFACNGNVFIEGLSASGSPSAITMLVRQFGSSGRGAGLTISGADLSWCASTLQVFASSANSNAVLAIIRNSKLPASWSGTVAGTITSPGYRAEMWNCSAGDVNYAMAIADYHGLLAHETTVVRTGGASDGDTPISWRMASNANAKWPGAVLVSPEIAVPNTTTGGAKTLTVEIVHDSVTNVTDKDIWLDVQYLGTSGFPLALYARDSVADVLAAAADQTDSSETWTTTGLTNPNTQKINVTVTPNEEGVFLVRVYLAATSKTVYVCPKVTVS